jgi:hypothetical protein
MTIRSVRYARLGEAHMAAKASGNANSPSRMVVVSKGAMRARYPSVAPTHAHDTRPRRRVGALSMAQAIRARAISATRIPSAPK